MIDYKEIEAKWQKAWDDAKIFEGEVSDKPAYMVTAAWPYVNTPLHIGHLRAFGTADALARYKRMRGFNVLYPMGFHATGTPVLAFAKRIKSNDQDIVDELHVFHVPDEEIKKMTDPSYIAAYFIKESGQLYRRSGFSMDPRRSFVSIDPTFSKMVEWQFGILDGKGFLTKGKHPVGWCPNENNAVGMHDTKHDVEPEIEQEVAIKFKVDSEDAFMLCTTYRPETIFGVTNIFVNSSEPYVICNIGDDGKRYYISKASAQVLKYQAKIEVIEELSAQKLLEKNCINPVSGNRIPVLPGFFVKGDVGTGVVMSVPAHAPFDYAALERLRKEGRLKQEIKPIKVLEVQIGRSLSDVSAGEAKPSQMDVPAFAYLEILHTNADAIDDMLEFATKLEYREESHWGKMIVKGYEGMSEPEAREKVKGELLEKGDAMEMYVLQNAPVYCRCGYEVVVKVVEDQWFIDYGNEGWKDSTRAFLKQMRLLPDKTRNAFEAAVDWIDLRAVARAQGLGTKFPLDRTKIIESLSDSTIYMSFYTISHLVKDVPPEKLKPDFFDFVFRGVGDAEKVAQSTDIDYSLVKKCRESFEYWYRDTSRHSGPDLIYNHLTMYVYNHIAVFDRAYWPKQIAVNGFVLSEGEKMSKSLGNIIPLVDAINKYGADPSRLNIIAGADLLNDSEYSEKAIRGIQERLEYLMNTVLGLDKLESGELKRIDYWLYSKLSGKIELATKYMDTLELRSAYTGILYDSVLELRRYFARKGSSEIAVKDFISAVVLMLQPVAPHVSEEIWHMLGNYTFASAEKWPADNREMRNEKVEAEEELVDSTVEDAKQVIALMQKKSGKKASKLHIIVASDWKRKLVNALAKEKDVGKALDSLQGDTKVDKEQAAKLAGVLAKRLNEVELVKTTQLEEFDGVEEAADYISKQLECDVSVEMEEKSKSQRASRAMPMKPSLDIEFA
ncbi:MAG: leucine--tRNA ligase [Candidatus Micrarchaeota archaeon]|nr:leucine--tRNA ligase [Candidatus Micrarchaeota archaeon]